MTSLLASYGGQLVEYPYSKDAKYKELEANATAHLSIPDIRRGRLRKLLAMKPTVSIFGGSQRYNRSYLRKKPLFIKTEKAYQFDGMWVSSLRFNRKKASLI